jgi:hypothetical protein
MIPTVAGIDLSVVMAGLVPASRSLMQHGFQGVAARDKRGHDESKQ